MCVGGWEWDGIKKRQHWFLYKLHYLHPLPINAVMESWQNQQWECTRIKLASKTKPLTVPFNLYIIEPEWFPKVLKEVSLPECVCRTLVGKRAHFHLWPEKAEAGGGWQISPCIKRGTGRRAESQYTQEAKPFLILPTSWVQLVVYSEFTQYPVLCQRNCLKHQFHLFTLWNQLHTTSSFLLIPWDAACKFLKNLSINRNLHHQPQNLVMNICCLQGFRLRAARLVLQPLL